MKPLTPSKAKNFIIEALKCKEIPYLSGPPGIGKSDIMAQVAEQFNLKLLDIRLSQMLPEDLTGLPQINEKTKRASYMPFDTFPLKGDKLPMDKDGYEMDGWLIFLDELSSASEEVMAAIYSLLLGHRIGGKEVHEKALIVGAGNRSIDSAIARPLPDTLITRMLPVEMKINAKEWVKWSKLPESNGNSTVSEFILKYPDMLLETVSSDKREELEPYATPRGWGKVNNIINMHEKNSKSKSVKHDNAGIPVENESAAGEPINTSKFNLIAAAVGFLCANTFKEHYNEAMSLPFPWDVAQSPSSTRIPSTSIGKATLTESLKDYFIESGEDIREKILQYMNRMDSEHRALFSEILSQKLGTTPSDLALIDSVNKRINTTTIDQDKISEDFVAGAIDCEYNAEYIRQPHLNKVINSKNFSLSEMDVHRSKPFDDKYDQMVSNYRKYKLNSKG